MVENALFVLVMLFPDSAGLCLGNSSGSGGKKNSINSVLWAERQQLPSARRGISDALMKTLGSWEIHHVHPKTP